MPLSLPDQPPAAPPSRARGSLAIRLFGAGAISCALAAYNRFPLTYSDSGSYVDNALDLLHCRRPWIFFRPATYGAFLTPFATGATLWLLPLAQGLIVAAVVHAALRAAGVALSLPVWLGVFAVLTACSSLPWFTGQIMPDVFSPAVILLSFVIVWAPAERWRPLWPVVLLMAFAIATHLSHFPIAAGLLLVGVLMRLAAEGELRSPRAFGRLALRAGAPLVLALVAVVLPNYARYRKPVLSRSSSLFVLAHLVGDGSAQRYLASACAVHRYRLCAERPSLRPDTDWFLWSHSGPRARSAEAMARGDSTLLQEAPAIVAGTVRQEWPWVIRHALLSGARQLVTFGAHPGEHSYSASVNTAMQRLGPSVGADYRASRQASRVLATALPTRIHYAAAILALLSLGWTLPRLRGTKHRPFRRLTVTVAVGLVLNAFVLAGLSTVHPRYQGRVVWLVVLIALVAATEWAQERRRGPAASTAPSG